MKLNLGACDRKLDGFVSVDICPPADQIADLAQRWPWEDSTIDAIAAYDIVEHLPNKIHTMNEAWRVLKRGCLFVIEVPSASHGAGAFQDPTHKTFWTRNDFQYYQEGSLAVRRFATSYGITARFKIVELDEREHKDIFEPVWKIRAVLEAVK